MKKNITSATAIIACIGFPLGQICAALISSSYTGDDALVTSAAQLCVVGYFWFTGTRQP